MALTALQTYLLLNSLVLLAIGILAALLLLMELRMAAAAFAVVVALAGPATYSFATAAAPHTGALPAAGPNSGVTFGGGPGGGPGGGMGGLLDAPSVGDSLAALLREGDQRWAAATVGSNNAAGYQLASDRPVLAVGGFNGTDPSPTLAQFQTYVRSGQIHYFLGDAGMSSTDTGGSDAARQIAEWVAENYQATQVNNVAVYDLS
jgi:hypothetical protein